MTRSILIASSFCSCRYLPWIYALLSTSIRTLASGLLFCSLVSFIMWVFVRKEQELMFFFLFYFPLYCHENYFLVPHQLLFPSLCDPPCSAIVSKNVSAPFQRIGSSFLIAPRDTVSRFAILCCDITTIWCGNLHAGIMPIPPRGCLVIICLISNP